MIFLELLFLELLMKFEFWEKCLFWKQAINKSKINPDYIIWLYLNYHYSAESHAERAVASVIIWNIIIDIFWLWEYKKITPPYWVNFRIKFRLKCRGRKRGGIFPNMACFTIKNTQFITENNNFPIKNTHFIIINIKSKMERCLFSSQIPILNQKYPF